MDNNEFKTEISVEELKKLELDILKYLKNVCSENGLTYYLAFGTLLGAVRHKGFIPWDDDIDVWMPREDYEKLKIIMRNKVNSRYLFVTPKEYKNYGVAFGKIIDKKTLLVEESYSSEYDLGVYINESTNS